MIKYDLNRVIKEFKKLIKELPKDSLHRKYYEIIVRFLLLEHKYPYEVKKAGKPIYHYFMYYLPIRGADYFEFLYNPYHPVRFAVETFDSIEEIRLELKK